MSLWEIAQILGTLGGLAFGSYVTGRGAKGAARWLRRRREQRDRRLRR